ncbi:iron ABC transporter permease [Macrococcus caseolyticus]|nr:iron ABC transporter permease [Macrococcus caseolyticus]
MLGFHKFSLIDLYGILFQNEQSAQRDVLFNLRIPRTVIALLVGMLLGISGLMIQTITRNPFASPGIMGINSGASLCVVCAIVIFKIDGTFMLSMIAFAGAFVIAIMIVAATIIPLRPLNIMELTLFGASLSALCMAVTQGVLIYNESAIEQVIYWLSGSVSNRKLTVLHYLWPFMIIGIVLSIINIKHLNLFNLDDLAMTSIGGNIVKIKLLVMTSVALLSGSAVAMAGPIAFVGLITPHITKLMIKSHNHKVMMPASGLIGAVLLITSDILSRFILYPQELPVGIATAIIGAPIFFYLILKRKGSLT